MRDVKQDATLVLADALSQGRLALAEIAGMSAAELDAIYALAIARLDARHFEDALHLITALITLMPFCAKYWRAYGVTLHQSGVVERALAAYDAALVLEPDHLDIQCYRAELLIYLQRHQDARAVLQTIHTSDVALWSKRAGALLALLDVLPAAHPAPTPPPITSDKTEQISFQTPDGEQLPLATSRFETPEALTNDITQTAIVRQRRIPAPMPLDSREEVTQTAVVRRRLGIPLQLSEESDD